MAAPNKKTQCFCLCFYFSNKKNKDYFLFTNQHNNKTKLFIFICCMDKTKELLLFVLFPQVFP